MLVHKRLYFLFSGVYLTCQQIARWPEWPSKIKLSRYTYLQMKIIIVIFYKWQVAQAYLHSGGNIQLLLSVSNPK